jgi:hypothetical protein
LSCAPSASPEWPADALAFALRFDGRTRKHDAAEMMAAIVAKRLVEHLERAGFVVMKRPPIGGADAMTEVDRVFDRSRLQRTIEQVCCPPPGSSYYRSAVEALRRWVLSRGRLRVAASKRLSDRPFE